MLLAKRDVKAAFKWMTINVDGIALMCIEILGSAVGQNVDVVVIFLVANFGWQGAPGEWMLWAWANKLYCQAYAPPRPNWTGSTRFHHTWLMDDGTLVEPALGDRPWCSAHLMEKGITRFYGSGGLNVDKLEAEGSFDIMGVMCGFILDTEGERSCRVPPLTGLSGLPPSRPVLRPRGP